MQPKFFNIRFCLLLFLLFIISNNSISQLPQKNHLICWFAGDSAVLSSGNLVQSLPDLSGNSYTAIQNNSLYQPQQIISPELNNHNIIRFDGSTSFLTTPAPYTTTLSLFLIFKQTNKSNYQHLIEPNGGGSTQVYLFGGSYTWQNSFTTNTFNTLTYKIISVIKKSDSSFCYINNLLNIKTNSASVASGSGWTIGKYNGGNLEYFNGDIAEIILYDTTLTIPEMNQVTTYLNNKYAPPVYLGANQIKNFCFKTLDAGSKFKSFLWSTGDTTQTITPTQTGAYWVDATNSFDTKSSDTIFVQTVVPNNFQDSVNCTNAPIIWNLGIDKSYYQFAWSDGSSDSSITVTQPDKYFAIITDSIGCVYKTDTFKIAPDNYTNIMTLSTDTTFCAGNTIALAAGALQTKTYQWSTGATSASIPVMSSGQYSLIATDSLGCVAKDTVNITISGIAPKSSFVYNSVKCAGDSVVLTDLSAAPSGNTITNYLWSFGDATTSVLPSPKHLYLLPDTGLFNVKLTVTTDAGCSKDTTIQLHVYPKPAVNFSNTLACSRNTAKFTSILNLKGYAAQSYLWNFADLGSGANNSSTLVNPTHLFANPGGYLVKYVVKNNKGCSDSLTKPVVVQSTPQVNFTTSVTCEKQKVYFTDSSSVLSPAILQSFSTNFGDGTPVGTVKNPIHTYTIIGPYLVKYIVAANNGCSDTILKTLNINSKPIAKIGLSGPYCVNSSIGFSDSSVVNLSSTANWKWTFDGTINSTLKNTSSTFTTAGTHNAKLVVASVEGCKDSTTRTFTINGLPTPGFDFSPLYGNPPLTVNFTDQSVGAIKYKWNFGDTGTSTLSAPTHIYQDTGLYIINLVITDSKGCTNTISKSFQIQNAVYDMALLQVQAAVDADNFLNISLSFGNKSTRPLTTADFVVDVEGDNGFKETWNGNLSIAGLTSYTLSTAPRLNTTTEHNYVCVTAKKPNGFQDIYPDDNQICVGLKSGSFILPDPNPNPVTDYILIPVIMPADDQVEFSLFNKMGQKLSDPVKYSLVKGYNAISYYTGSLAEGVYTYMVTYKNNPSVKKFIKYSK